MALPIDLVVSGSTLTISGNVSSGANVWFQVPVTLASVVATGSLSITPELRNIIFSGTSGHVTASLPSSPLIWEEHLFKDGDGKSPTRNIIISASAGQQIDGGFGHEISSSYGRARLLFVGNGLWNLVD